MIAVELQAFIQALSDHGNVTTAAKQAGVSRSWVYRHRVQNHEFSQAWDQAIEEAADRLAGEAVRRALNGVEEVRYFKGEPVGVVRKYSDQLLMFLLKAYKPSVFGHSKKGQKPRDGSKSDHARQELIKKMASFDRKDDPD
jgi:hypothetical protein